MPAYRKFRVITDKGAFMVYARDEAGAKKQIQEKGYVVTGVKTYGYKPPEPPKRKRSK